VQVFGAKPLEDVMRNLRSVLMSELEAALSQQVLLSATIYSIDLEGKAKTCPVIETPRKEVRGGV
jgi:hypothetical protein